MKNEKTVNLYGVGGFFLLHDLMVFISIIICNFAVFNPKEW